MTFTVTISQRPQPDAEERRLRALRAQEVLSGAGWLFDEYMSDLTRELLGTDPDESAKREQFFRQIDAAAQLKGRLEQIIQIQKAEQDAHERRISKLPPADHE